MATLESKITTTKNDNYMVASHMIKPSKGQLDEPRLSLNYSTLNELKSKSLSPGAKRKVQSPIFLEK